MAVLVEVGETDVLVVVLQPAEDPLLPGQLAGSVVEIEAAEAHLDGDGDIEIAILVDIGHGGVEPVKIRRDRHVGRRRITVSRQRRRGLGRL